MVQNEFPKGVVKETTFRFGIDEVCKFMSENGIKSNHHVIFDELICTECSTRFLDSILSIKAKVSSFWIAMGSVPLLGK